MRNGRCILYEIQWALQGGAVTGRVLTAVTGVSLYADSGRDTDGGRDADVTADPFRG